MFSRIKDALDRTIAEEQARHRTPAEQRAANTSTNDAVASPSTDPAKKPGQGGSAHPDPAMFDAAFRLEDDSNGVSRSATPKPSVSDENAKGVANDAVSEKNGLAQGQDGDTNKTAGADASQPPELPPQVRSKLKRLEKLEPNYQDVLRSYRIAHTQIRNFERALQENTPLSTIKDPAALMEYINQFSLKSDMAVQELRRVSAEKDDLKKRVDSSEVEFAILKDEIATLKGLVLAEKDGLEKRVDSSDVELADLKEKIATLKEAATTDNDAPADEVPENGDEQENVFSYDDEMPELQAEQIAKLELQINTLKEELAVAKEQGASTGQDAQKDRHGPSESGDDGALAKPESDTRDAEIISLKAALEDGKERIRHNEASLEKERSLHASKAAEVEMLEAVNKERNAELEKLSEKNAGITKQIAILNDQLEVYRKTDAFLEQLESAPTTNEATTSTNGSTKKKNKKKKKGGASPTVAENISETPESTDPSFLDRKTIDTLRDEISTLQETIATTHKERAELLAEMANKREDMAMLQQSLIDNGEDATEAKRKNQELEKKVAVLQVVNSELEKERETRKTAYAAFKARISELENEREEMKTAYTALERHVSELEGQMKSELEEQAKLVAANTTESISKQEAENESIKKALEDLKIQSHTLQSDLGASQKLAQDRFKELTNMKEILAKAQTEMKSLRQDSSDLKTTREEVVSKQNELRVLEKREKELKNEPKRRPVPNWRTRSEFWVAIVGV
ncbi:hypothetical protein F5B21DRAFT_449661 [Xylaria acuta]|nr:hypothetical protein F5B21DRAFT_449661 [Xylaria acuta]